MALNFRQAGRADIENLVGMLADDGLGATREDVSLPLNQKYRDAFEAIENDPNNELIVAVEGASIVGMLQLTFIPYLTHTGSRRCLIEGVRIHRDFRGRGFGRELFGWAIQRARQRGCAIVQLTSDKSRPDALRFYQSLGFNATHEGFKLRL